MQNITLRYPGGDESRPVLFDLNVLGAVQKRYGHIGALEEKASDPGELLWILMTLLNEAAKFEAFALSKPASLLTEEQVGMLVPVSSLTDGTIKKVITEALNECVGDSEKKT